MLPLALIGVLEQIDYPDHEQWHGWQCMGDGMAKIEQIVLHGAHLASTLNSQHTAPASSPTARAKAALGA